MAMPTAERPSSANAVRLLRGPGSMTVQPKAESGTRRDEDSGEFQQSMGDEQTEEGVQPARGLHQPESDAQVEHVLEQHPQHRQPQEDTEYEADGGGLCVVRPDLGGEGSGRVARVVRLVLAAGACHLADFVRSGNRCTDVRVGACPPADERRREHAHQGGGNPPVAASVHGRGAEAKKWAASRQADLRGPVTAFRARATSDVSLPVRAGSGVEVRIKDRWVEARW